MVVSGSSEHDEVAASFKALEAGAVAFVKKPNGIGHAMHDESVKQLLDTVKLMSEIKVVRRWPRRQPRTAAIPPTKVTEQSLGMRPRLVAIGASTGGPIALKAILSDLPKDFPLPILIVQHIAAGFTAGFSEWLAQSSGFPVRVATDGEPALPGHAYVAPDGYQMSISAGGFVILSDDAPENGHRPSVSHLFRSVAAAAGRNGVGVLLTGMGKDGAEELKLMKQRGALTIVQDPESCVIHGMPGAAISLHAETYVLPPSAIAQTLSGLCVTYTKEKIGDSKD
jgi:two-component system chemotaxis response regulator CheB